MEKGIDIGRLSYKRARLEIAFRIKEARMNSGLHQKDVAKELSISQSSYSRMEAGMVAPDIAQIRVLSGLYDLSILWLIGLPNYFVTVNQSSSSSPPF